MISLYGNLIYDTVKYVNNFSNNSSNDCHAEYQSVGALGNIIRNLNALDNKKNMNIISNVGKDYQGFNIINEFINYQNLNLEFLRKTETKTSEAIIIIDKNNNQKTSIVNWGACRENRLFYPIVSEWSHFSYVDTLPNLSETSVKKIKDSSNFLSIDLCKNRTNKETVLNVLSFLKYVDFLFISDNEINNFNIDNDKEYKSICKKISKKYNTNILFHYDGGSIFSYDNEIYEHKIEKIEKQIDVLGAGDSFCAAFINSKLNKNTYEESIAFSHKHATCMIQNQRIING